MTEEMQILRSAHDLDPLGLDEFYRLGSPVMGRDVHALLDWLAGAVHRASSASVDAALQTRPAALAALRDLEHILCAAHTAEPCSYKRVAGLEQLLQRLGTIAGHPPRGSSTTYFLANPLDERMRLFTGLDEERMFVTELAIGLQGLDDILCRLGVLVDSAIDTPEAAAATQDLSSLWEPMVGATVAMLRRMPPEVFSGRIVTCFIPLDIAGAQYQGITGAQVLNCGIDYLLWGVESTNAMYLPYARTNLGEQLPRHRELIADIVDHAGGVSLLTHLERQLTAGVRDGMTAAAVLEHLASLLRRISTFRKAHLRVAAMNLPLRETATGSGGHPIELLEMLAAATQQARERLRQLRSLLASGADADAPPAAVARPPVVPGQDRAGEPARR